jgi:hypothetical protein
MKAQVNTSELCEASLSYTHSNHQYTELQIAIQMFITLLHFDEFRV